MQKLFARGLGAMALTSAVFGTSEARAQAWIGQVVGNMIANQQAAAQEAACMSGTAMSEAEVAEAINPARSTMASYWRAVQSGKPANVANLYNLGSKARWSGGGRVLAATQLTAVSDPFATTNASFDEKPLALVRAGDGASARGQWAVRDMAGKRTGTYTALFTRQLGQWHLSALDLSPASEYVDRVVQYCHKGGDVLPYRLTQSQWLHTYTERRSAKAKLKASAATEKATAAQARVDRDGVKANAQSIEGARLAAERASKMVQEAAARDTEATATANAAATAKADADAWEAERAAGRARAAAGQVED